MAEDVQEATYSKIWALDFIKEALDENSGTRPDEITNKIINIIESL